MAEKEDQLGLMPSLSMGPSGYIPPMAATLASGLSGITAQQSALQRQLAQEQLQREKEAQADRERRAQTQLSLGQTLEDPRMLASGASVLLGSPVTEQQFTPFMEQKAQARNADILNTLIKAGLSKKAAAKLVPLILGKQIQQAPAAAPAPAVTPAPAPMPEAAPVVMPNVLPAPPALTTAQAPVSATTQAPAEAPLMFMGVPLEFGGDGPENALETVYKAFTNQFSLFEEAGAKNRMTPKLYNSMQRKLRPLQTKATAAYAGGDIDTLQQAYAELNSMFPDLGPSTGVAPFPTVTRKVGSKFITDTVVSIDENTGRAVSIESIAAPTPMTPQEQNDLALRQFNARLDAARVALARVAEDRQQRGQILSALEKRFPAFNRSELEARAAGEIREQLKFEFPIVQNNPVLSQQNLEKQRSEFSIRYPAKVQQKIDEAVKGIQSDPNAAAWLDNFLVNQGVLPRGGRVIERSFGGGRVIPQ